MNLDEYAKRNAALNALSCLVANSPLDAVDLLILWTLQDSASSPSGLAEMFSISNPQVSRRLRKLIAFELIAETLDVADLRSYSVAATPKSSNVLHEIRRNLGKDADDAFDCLRFLMLLRQYVSHELSIRLSGLTAARVLAAVACSRVPLTVGQISEACGLPQSSVSCGVSVLEKHCLACRHRNQRGADPSSDARFVTVDLTDRVSEIRDLLDFQEARTK